MQRILFLILGVCLLATDASSHSRQKRDTRTFINDALSLYYYGQNFKMPSITLNTDSSSMACGAGGYGGYWIQDIIGQADNVASLEDCLYGCWNIPDCVAMNYVGDLGQCVALRSTTADPNDLLWGNELAQTYHYFFTDCAQKIPKPATKPSAGSAPAGCGLPYFQQNILAGARTRIIGGTEAVPYSYPWIGRVQYDIGNGYVSNCGSSLVRNAASSTMDTQSDIVITAAHCVLNDDKSERNPGQFTLFFGSHDNRFVEAQEQKVGVKKVVYHPDYKTKGIADIAVLKLTTPIKFNNYISPICMANIGQVPADKNSCVAAGWGRLNNSNNETPNRLQQVKYPVQDDTVCKAGNIWGMTFDPATMTCAGPLDGSVSTCQGDSGGPLACFESGHWTLYGATSFGNGVKVNGLAQCAASNKPAVFARISGLRAWIDTTITNLKNA